MRAAGSLLLAVVLIGGCVGQTGTEGLPGQQVAGGEQPQPDNKLTTTITPARDLTGHWAGNADWHDNVGNPACSYSGDIVFDFQQDGNVLTGTWQVNILEVIPHLDVPCAAPGPSPVNSLQGTVSSSSFTFTSGSPELVFEGTFTTDLMQGSFESCPGQCTGGTVGSKGTFSAIRAS